ncbi:hypothetical protein BC826DRAFT_1190178 [Russula brevipes]|nr:hypothetical protein BC826DRAFT_1190178 [Russula brevipes]
MVLRPTLRNIYCAEIDERDGNAPGDQLNSGITLAAEVQHAFSTTVDATLRSKLPNVLRHFETIVNQPNLTLICGSTAFAKKALQYTPPPKEKNKAPAAPPEPKAEKKPKKEEVDDDKPYEEAPKEKNPLDLLPKSTPNLEDWKRAYSNKNTRGVDGSPEWLYQNFDKEGLLHSRVIPCVSRLQEQS